MGELEMDAVRKRLRLLDPNQVRIAFVGGSAGFECVPCDQSMVWVMGKMWWVCPECGYEMTVQEAWDLLRQALASMKVLKKDVRQKRKG
jgi:ribosomal protein L37AE/L43A